MTTRAALTLLLLVGPASVGLWSPLCLADEPPAFALTTDTPAYCTQLARQILDRHSNSADVQRLLSDGRDMCDRGQIRGGIRRLRRALVILHHRKDEPPH
jgi:hypothetical protein